MNSRRNYTITKRCNIAVCTINDEISGFTKGKVYTITKILDTKTNRYKYCFINDLNEHITIPLDYLDSGYFVYIFGIKETDIDKVKNIVF